ncbi:hypothetical protein LTR56_018984 [Elasticomyces elasticus]|nr:hypothetical protein LTR56_018984 [Elasticomyces elasticus]KAK3635548.1 hypothetical protein LTR22_019116 [Elasticomyces elasticus]KAK4911749.1 hypothetical protein LTR49_019739 [Elasticomyces elasticus]KAK5769786.1 hypothetical protein LTS12_000236 [Elasticomyces elasticus]
MSRSQEDHPSDPKTFYPQDPTNHYARLVHEVNIDGKGYAFAYDDVQPDGGEDQSGKVNAGDPVLFTVTVGGKSAAGGGVQQQQQQQPIGQQEYTRGPPPPPPGQGEKEHEGGLRGKLKGLAGRFGH